MGAGWFYKCVDFKIYNFILGCTLDLERIGLVTCLTPYQWGFSPAGRSLTDKGSQSFTKLGALMVYGSDAQFCVGLNPALQEMVEWILLEAKQLWTNNVCGQYCLTSPSATLMTGQGVLSARPNCSFPLCNGGHREKRSRLLEGCI